MSLSDYEPIGLLAYEPKSHFRNKSANKLMKLWVLKFVLQPPRGQNTTLLDYDDTSIETSLHVISFLIYFND